jgi:hypothetical protein
MLRSALADTAHAWLWLDLELDGRRRVRVAGPGALDVVCEVDGRAVVLRDAGLRVALQAAGNTYLNSSAGPITIRAAHADPRRGCVRLLARLPAVDTAAAVVQTARPVPGRWTVRR